MYSNLKKLSKLHNSKGQSVINFITYCKQRRKIKLQPCPSKMSHNARFNGQIKPKAGLASHRFSQKRNELICFVCCKKQKSKQNKFVCSFFGRNYGATICFRFYLTFKKSNKTQLLWKSAKILFDSEFYYLLGSKQAQL